MWVEIFQFVTYSYNISCNSAIFTNIRDTRIFEIYYLTLNSIENEQTKFSETQNTAQLRGETKHAVLIVAINFYYN